MLKWSAESVRVSAALRRRKDAGEEKKEEDMMALSFSVVRKVRLGLCFVAASSRRCSDYSLLLLASLSCRGECLDAVVATASQRRLLLHIGVVTRSKSRLPKKRCE